MEGWANDPTLEILVDKLPDRSELHFECRNGLYFAESDGYVSFISKKDPTIPDDGFGGAHQTLIMQDRTVLSFKGGWSSRAGVANKLGFTECMDVSLTDEPKSWERGYTFLAGHVTYEFAKNAVWEFLPEVNLVRVDKDSSFLDSSEEQSHAIEHQGEDREYIYVPMRVDNPCGTCKGAKKYPWMGKEKSCIKCLGTGHHLPKSKLYHRTNHDKLKIPFLDTETELKWHISGRVPKDFQQVATILSSDVEEIYSLTNTKEEYWPEATYDVKLPDGSIRQANELIWLNSRTFREGERQGYRSTSIGDVVVLENDTVWQCASLGWDPVPITKERMRT